MKIKQVRTKNLRHCDIHDRCIKEANKINKSTPKKTAILVCGVDFDGIIPGFKIANTLWKLRHNNSEVYYVTIRSFLYLPTEVKEFMGKVVFVTANSSKSLRMVANNVRRNKNSVRFVKLYEDDTDRRMFVMPWYTSIDTHLLSDGELTSVKFDDSKDPKVTNTKREKCPVLKK